MVKLRDRFSIGLHHSGENIRVVDGGTALVLWSDPRAIPSLLRPAMGIRPCVEGTAGPRFARKSIPKPIRSRRRSSPPGIITIQCSVSSGIKALWKLNKENGDVNSASVRHSYTVISNSLKTKDGSPARTTTTLSNAKSVSYKDFNGLDLEGPIGPEKPTLVRNSYTESSPR